MNGKPKAVLFLDSNESYLRFWKYELRSVLHVLTAQTTRQAKEVFNQNNGKYNIIAIVIDVGVDKFPEFLAFIKKSAGYIGEIIATASTFTEYQRFLRLDFTVGVIKTDAADKIRELAHK